MEKESNASTNVGESTLEEKSSSASTSNEPSVTTRRSSRRSIAPSAESTVASSLKKNSPSKSSKQDDSTEKPAIENSNPIDKAKSSAKKSTSSVAETSTKEKTVSDSNPKAPRPTITTTTTNDSDVNKEVEQDSKESTKKNPAPNNNNKNTEKKKTKPIADNKTKEEPTSSSSSQSAWKIGDLVEAKDASDNWYKSRLVDIDEEEKQIKVHFLGWNSRYDQWFDMNGDDVRLFKRENTQANNTVSSTSTNTNKNIKSNEMDETSIETMAIGSKVLAKWNDESFYPATILKHSHKNGVVYYQVKFYDGVQRSVRFSNVKVMTDEDAKLFAEEIKAAPAVVINENKSAEAKIEMGDRHAEAELLLAIQEPKIIQSNEPKPSQVDEKVTKEEEKETTPNNSAKPADAPAPTTNTTTGENAESLLNDSSRKSLRVKRLRVYTQEIVFDSPASSITYNLASVSNPVNLVIDKPPPVIPACAKKRKLTSSVSIGDDKSLDGSLGLDDSVFEESKPSTSTSKMDVDVADASNTKEEQTKKVQNYFKSLKLFKSSKKSLSINVKSKTTVDTVEPLPTPTPTPTTAPVLPVTPSIQSADQPSTSGLVSKSGRISISSKRKQEYEEEKAEEIKAREQKRLLKLAMKQKAKEEKVVKTKTKKVRSGSDAGGDSSSETNNKKELKKLKKKMDKKKLKKDKKKLLKKLIESSQQQLKQQQELIEKQLKKHEHKKSQKKLQKLLKHQQLQLQFQIQQQIQLQQQQIQQQQQQQKQQPTQTFNIFFPPTPTPQLFNNFLFSQNSLTSLAPVKATATTTTSRPSLVTTSSLHQFVPTTPVSTEPIKCHIEDCNKTFRKQSLLEYHLKYHHYTTALQTTPSTTTSAGLSQQVSSTSVANPISPALFKQRSGQVKRGGGGGGSRLSSFNNEDSNMNDEYLDGDDPYEVIHCKCGNHISVGFMIQCEICLCWQHGDCINVKTSKNVPKNYLCWICKTPNNKLKQLKYQNWMGDTKCKELSMLSLSSKSGGETNSSGLDLEKLRLLNECSQKYYNLNLLMYTLEYQMSIMKQMSKSEPLLNVQDVSQLDLISDLNRADLKEETIDHIEKLLHNISHLQNCLAKKFDDLNSKIDEFETKYNLDDDENFVTRNFNLEELYSQLQSIMSTTD